MALAAIEKKRGPGWETILRTKARSPKRTKIIVKLSMHTPCPSWFTNADIDVFWPEELLPETFGDLRIITWGYDSNLKGLASGKIQSSLYDFGTGLLQDLVDERDEDAVSGMVQ